MPNALVRDPSAWINGQPILQSELSAIDLALATSVNGEGGGSYTQGDDDTTIAGAGVWLAASADHAISGLGTIVYSPDGQPIVHADSDYTTLAATHAGRARALVTSCNRGHFVAGWGVDTTAAKSLASSLLGAEFMVPLRVHNGARLTSATLRFSVATDHGPPAELPKVRVLRVATTGIAVALTTNKAHGFATLTTRPASSAAWFASGAVQSIGVTIDAGVVIDVSRFAYFAHVIEERSTGAAFGNSFHDVRCGFDDIFDLRPQ